MKENWERSKPIHLLSKPEIKKMLHAFLPTEEIESTQLLGGGYSNSNFKIHIKSSETPFLLRVCREKTCRIERVLHDKLHKHMPVPRIFYSEFRGDQSFSLMEWKPGVQLKKVMFGNNVIPLRDAAFSAGYWLSEIRKIKFAKPGFFNESLEVDTTLKLTPDTFMTFMEDFLIKGHTRDWLGTELTDQLLAFTHSNQHFLDSIDSEPALVHSDYNGLNILVSENPDSCQVTGLIDWEFAFAGPVEIDIGNQLRYENIPYYQEFENAFIEGLQSGGERLSPYWKKNAKLVDLIALCDLLNNRHGGENRVSDIKQLITQTMTNWHNY